MKEYDSGFSRTILMPVTVAVILTVAIFSGAVFLTSLPTTTEPPTTTIPTTTTTTLPTTPTTTTTTPVGTYGALAADYITSRQNDIDFFWACNNTFVNGDLSSFYDGQHSGAYVDSVRMTNGVSTPSIVV
ncbi:MAG: hypothetical protein RTU92_02955, partial [Candidatus Thorarchaeota archaeon]